MNQIDVQNLNPKQLLQCALMCSYIYYHRYCSLVEDEVFDFMMKRLLEEWDNFEHQHKYLLTKEDLQAGTAFKIKHDDYPQIIVSAAVMWMDEKSINDNMGL